MSDAEHELVVENELLRSEVARARAIALRAVETAKAAQDAVDGHHEPWLDRAADDLDVNPVDRGAKR
jgi:hypothetical protein